LRISAQLKPVYYISSSNSSYGEELGNIGDNLLLMGFSLQAHMRTLNIYQSKYTLLYHKLEDTDISIAFVSCHIPKTPLEHPSHNEAALRNLSHV